MRRLQAKTAHVSVCSVEPHWTVEWRRSRWVGALVVVVSALTWSVADAAEEQGEGPAFDVASVKASSAAVDRRHRSRIIPGGRFAAQGRTLKSLLSWAHDLDDNRVLEGPDWIDDDRFDIAATFDGGADVEAETPRVRQMLRALLAERFALRVRREWRDMPYFALVVANPDGRRPVGVRPSTLDCAKIVAHRQRDGLLCPIDWTGPHCELRVTLLGQGRVTESWGGQPMAVFAQGLEANVGLVEDETGLVGRFDIELTYGRAPTAFPLPGRYGGAPPLGTPSIFDAVEELGLRLESRHGPIDVLVVEYAERPPPN